MADPRAYTPDECRRMFLDHIRETAAYWATVNAVDNSRTIRECMDGLVFSILAMLDGSTTLPGFKVIPAPHPDDREYHESHGDNWWPEDVDLAGSLHEAWCRHG